MFILCTLLLLSSLESNYLFEVKWQTPIENKPLSVQSTCLNGKIFVALGTSNAFMVLDDSGKIIFKSHTAQPVRAIMAKHDSIWFSFGKNLYFYLLGKGILRKKVLGSEIKSIDVDSFIYALSSREIYIISPDFNHSKRIKLPFYADTLKVVDSKYILKGKNWVGVWERKGVPRWLYRERGACKGSTLKLNDEIYRLPLLRLSGHTVSTAFLKERGSALVVLDFMSGKVLFRKELQDYVTALYLEGDTLFATTFDSAGEGRVLKFLLNGRTLVNERITFPYFLLEKYAGNRRFLTFQLEVGLACMLNRDLNELVVQYIEHNTSLPLFVRCRDEDFPDLIGIVKPSGDTPYRCEYYANTAKRSIKKADEWVRDAPKLKNEEKALALLGAAKSIYFLFEPEKAESVDELIRKIALRQRFKRQLAGFFIVFRNSLIFFAIFMAIFIGIRELWKRRPVSIDYDVLRQLEGDFFHDTRKKLRLIGSTLHKIQEKSDLRFLRYLEDDLKELRKIFEDSKPLLKKAHLRKFNIKRFEKNLEHFERLKDPEDLERLKEQIEMFHEDLKTYMEPLDRAVIEAVKRFKNSYKQKLSEVNFELQVEDKNVRYPSLYKDYIKRLSDIMYNLLTNSLEALEESDKKIITVRLGRVRNRSPYSFVIEVSDTGKGMDEETKSQFFRKGFTKGKTTGSGLGVTEETVEFIKRLGDFEVESEPGKGTSIRIYIG